MRARLLFLLPPSGPGACATTALRPGAAADCCSQERGPRTSFLQTGALPTAAQNYFDVAAAL